MDHQCCEAPVTCHQQGYQPAGLDVLLSMLHELLALPDRPAGVELLQLGPSADALLVAARTCCWPLGLQVAAHKWQRMVA